MTWRGEPEPVQGAGKIGVFGWLRLIRRVVPILVALLIGLAGLMLTRGAERIFCRGRRVLSPNFAMLVSRFALFCLGFRTRVSGQPMQSGGAVVANHSTWADIFALNAYQRVCFVAKAEVRGWPGIGLLARATGTVFIRRDPREAAAQRDLFRQRLAAGGRLLFFPEGTSTDGRRVLPFRSTLFDAFLGEGMEQMRIQPVSVTWLPPEGEMPGYYGWWGDMDFASNLMMVLTVPKQGRLELTYHPPVLAAEIGDRKRLAQMLGDQVRGGQLLAEGRAN